MATNTYTALRTTTVGTATPSVTLDLTGITGYTDLRIVYNGTISATGMDIRWRFNGDTGSNYSFTYINGNGSTASSGRQSNTTYIASYATTGTSGAPGTILFDVMNYSNTTTYKTTLSRVSDAPVELNAYVGLWRSTSAITSITIFPNANNITAGSTFTLYGISDAGDTGAKAIGGNVTSDATYVYHTFTMSGRFTPTQTITADYLVVAGGGGGGGNGGAGGGAGGFRTATGQSLTAGSYQVVVGGGGRGVLYGKGTNGNDSSFNGLASAGGGAASGVFASGGTDANDGGSGGGGNYNKYAGLGNVPSTSPSQGNNGGGSTTSNNLGTGGGGGAGAVGGTGTSTNCGVGGAGAASSISGTSVTYAGGGGGGGAFGATPAAGGAGGGGAGSTGDGVSGTANLGGGGGGGQASGGFGGSGIVIIRYAK